MAAHANEHERTMAFAEIALGQIRALRQPATPRHFEVWYTYATGYNPSLNQMINEMLARAGTLSEADVDRIHASYISSNRFTDRIDRVGTQVMGEIEQVMTTIGAAAGTASSYGLSLADVAQRLALATDQATVQSIVETLAQTTKEMEQNNQALEDRLSASMREISQLRHILEALRTESLTDPLTSLANRKFFDDTLSQAITEARANGEALSLAMADVDHFKAFNDTYGHLTGDQVLRLVAMSVKQNVKSRDMAARYGGEEFAVVLPNTALPYATKIADHIRRVVMTKELTRRSTGETLGRVTLSVGVAALHDADNAQSLIERADACLYAAKRNGRNRVVSEVDPEMARSGTTKVA
jgi:diguanylate cyclase